MDNEAVREALINLDRSREKERTLREQANNLLEGLEIITSAAGTREMLDGLLQKVTEQLACDSAFILSPVERDGVCTELECIGATDPCFSEQRWSCDRVFQRVLSGSPAMLFSVERVEEWIRQTRQVRENTGSVLLISFPGVDRQMMIGCVSLKRAYFKKSHLGLMQRLMPIASHALTTLHINEQLQQEIDERNRLEQYASFQAGIAEMSASVLHNIGNTVTGIQGHLLRMDHQRTQLRNLEPIFHKLKEWADEESVSAERQENMSKVLHGVLQLLDQEVGEEGNMTNLIQLMERSTLHVSEIIQMQRGVSRPVLTASHFDIRQMVEDTLSMIEEGIERREIEVEIDIQPSLETLYLPRNPMIQMLLNLVKNSIESIDERLRAGANCHVKITIRFLPDGEMFTLVVEDNGVGVESERLKLIFQFGESSKERGSGFGLHSVANFVNGIGGKVWMESEGESRGARALVRLPVAMSDKGKV